MAVVQMIRSVQQNSTLCRPKSRSIARTTATAIIVCISVGLIKITPVEAANDATHAQQEGDEEDEENQPYLEIIGIDPGTPEHPEFRIRITTRNLGDDVTYEAWLLDEKTLVDVPGTRITSPLAQHIRIPLTDVPNGSYTVTVVAKDGTGTVIAGDSRENTRYAAPLIKPGELPLVIGAVVIFIVIVGVLLWLNFGSRRRSRRQYATLRSIETPLIDLNAFYPISRTPYYIGRDFENNLVINHPSISANHAAIRFGFFNLIRRAYYIYDRDSRNGTMLNGRRLEVQQEAVLAHGDRIRFADIEFEFLLR